MGLQGIELRFFELQGKGNHHGLHKAHMEFTAQKVRENMGSKPVAEGLPQPHW